MHARSVAIVLLSLVVAASGCSHWSSRSNLDYRTIKSDPNHDSEKAHAENDRAIRWLEKGNADKAEQALQKALIADVTYGPAHNNLGKVYYSQGKYYLAAWEFEYAAKLMPHRPECHNNLGLIYEAVGKLDDAIEAYTLAYEMDAKNPAIIGNFARARVRRGDVDPVLDQLLRDLRLYDTRPAWLRWANERLALAPPTPNPNDAPPRRLDAPLNAPQPEESVAPETIPLPSRETDRSQQLPPPERTARAVRSTADANQSTESASI